MLGGPLMEVRANPSGSSGAVPRRTATVDVGTLLDSGNWTPYQKWLTLLAALAVIFDGVDIQILGFAIPSIIREWHVARGDFALVLAVGLAGMAVGSPFAGYSGDRFGRRPALMGCVLLFACATIGSAFCHSLASLAVLRFFTGMGAGGALPNASSLSAELAPLRWRPVAVTITIVGVPLGGMLGGIAAAWILPAYGWRAMYLLGGAAPLALLLLLFFALPESPRYMARHAERWKELAGLLKRMGHSVPAAAAFDDVKGRVPSGKIELRSMLTPDLRRDTAGLWIAFFANLNGAYLVFGWLPAMLTSHGLGLSAASSGLAAYNFGGVIGALTYAVLISASGSRLAMTGGAAAGALSALALILVPISPPNGSLLLTLGFALHGFFANAVQTSMFALSAHVYPSEVRASGIATAAAVGRAGAILSSFTGAAIIQGGSGAFLGTLAASMAVTACGLAIVRHAIPGRARQV